MLDMKNKILRFSSAFFYVVAHAWAAAAYGQQTGQPNEKTPIEAFSESKCPIAEKKPEPLRADASSDTDAPVKAQGPDCRRLRDAARAYAALEAERAVKEMKPKTLKARLFELKAFLEEDAYAGYIKEAEKRAPETKAAAAERLQGFDTEMRDALAGGNLNRVYDLQAKGSAGSIAGGAAAAAAGGGTGWNGTYSTYRPGWSKPLDDSGMPVPVMSAMKEKPQEPGWLPWMGGLALEGGKRTLHAAGSVLALPFEAIGTGAQGVWGAVNVVEGVGLRAGGWAAETGGKGLSWLGEKTGSARLKSAGEGLTDAGLVTSEAGSETAGKGVALVGGMPARVVNALARPITSLVSPEYEPVSLKQGRYAGALARTIDMFRDGRFMDQAPKARQLAALGHTDAMAAGLIDDASREKNPLWRYGEYGLAVTVSATDKVIQALGGGGVLKDVGGQALRLLGLGAMAEGTVEQGAQHYDEYKKAKTPEQKEAAVVKAVKSAADLTAMLRAGHEDEKAGGAVPEHDPRFLTSAEAKPLVLEAKRRVDALKARLAEQGAPELTPAQEREAVQTHIHELLNPPNAPQRSRAPGGIAIFDNDAGLPADDAAWLRDQGLVIDHHGPYYDANHPEVNATMQLLHRVAKAMASGDREAALAGLKEDFANYSTNNLGDGAWSDWVVNNLDRVAGDPALQKLIWRATKNEDFTFFGPKGKAAAEASPKAAEAQELQSAVFRSYDEAMIKHGVKGADRFDSLPGPKQRALLAEVREGITRAVDDPGFRRSQAAQFESRLSDAKSQVAAAEFQLDPAAREALAKQGVDPKVMDDVFVYDGTKVNADGLFAGWGAAPQSKGDRLLLAVRPLPDGKTGFIFSVPNGMEAPSLAGVGKALREAEAAKVTELQARDADVKAGNVGGRDSLQFSFDGLHLSPQEVLQVVARERAKAAVQGVEGAEVSGRAKAEPAPPPWEGKPRYLTALPSGLEVGEKPLRVGSPHTNVYAASFQGREAALKVDARSGEAEVNWRAGQVPLPENVHVTKVIAAERWNGSTLRRYGLEGKVDPETAARYVEEGRSLLLMERLPEDSVPLHSYLYGPRKGIAKPEARQRLVAAVEKLNELGIVHGDLETRTNLRWRRDPVTGEDHFYILDFGQGKSKGAPDRTQVDARDIHDLIRRWEGLNPGEE